MKKFIQQFIPEKYTHDEEIFRKARLFVNTCFITSIFSSFYFLTSFNFDMHNVMYAMVFNVVGFIILPFVLMKDLLPLKILANTYILIGTVGVLIVVFNTGGLQSSVLPWLAVLPLASLMLIDKKSGWFWTVTSYISITVIGILTINSFNFKDETSKAILNIFNTSNLNGLGVLIFLIALVFENTKNTALKNLDDKNKQLDKEKHRSDELLLNILPQEVMEELKETGFSKARLYNHVTVLFTDFVNFTQISEKLSPEDLVAEIDFCFKGFDNIIERNGLEKIKTIGDAYLAVCGLPNEDKDHAINCVKASLEIIKFMQKRKEDGGLFEIRIGINSGSVVAGIVGIKKYAYDIWGDTVNTAARMEQNSETGKINISGSTFDLIRNDFNCKHRGKIEAKNKGEIDMYFVN